MADLIADLQKEFGAAYSEVPFDDFFARLTRTEDWHTPIQKRTAKKFRLLKNLLRANLRDVCVLRFGKIRIDIFVTGLDENGDLAGIRTRAVET